MKLDQILKENSDSNYLKELENISISKVEVNEEDNDIYSIVLHLGNGDEIKISPTSYNYGHQHLRIDRY